MHAVTERKNSRSSNTCSQERQDSHFLLIPLLFPLSPNLLLSLVSPILPFLVLSSLLRGPRTPLRSHKLVFSALVVRHDDVLAVLNPFVLFNVGILDRRSEGSRDRGGVTEGCCRSCARSAGGNVDCVECGVRGGIFVIAISISVGGNRGFRICCSDRIIASRCIRSNRCWRNVEIDGRDCR